jgi:peptide/nickel transport system permease protein
MSTDSLSSLGGRLSDKQLSRYLNFLGQIRRNSKAMLGLSIVLGLILIAIFAPLVAPYDPEAISGANKVQSPTLQHPFGTDNFGRDIFSRVLYGARISIYVGLMTVGISISAGVPLGLVAGYYGGLVDEVVMRIMDAMMSFPPILLALVIMAALGPNLTNVLLALGFVYTPYLARVTRSSTLETVNKEYVQAAEARGEGDLFILFKEVMPNTLAPVIVQASISFAFAILAEAALSFLGMGTQPPTPSWGLMINEGRGYLTDAPWMAVFPGIAIGITVLGLNMFGDALRDILDPKVGTAGGEE